MTHAAETPELLIRPEPNFEEGQRWPRTGLLGRVLWSLVLLLLLGAFIAALVTDMVVQVPVTGVVTAGSPPQVQFVVTDRVDAMQLGLPVRVQDDEKQVWAVIVAMEKGTRETGEPFVRATASMIEAEGFDGVVAGQSCSARVLVGKTRTITGLWKLATNQVLTADRGEVGEMQGYVPRGLRGWEGEGDGEGAGEGE